MDEKLTREEILKLIKDIEQKPKIEAFTVSFAIDKTYRLLLSLQKSIGKAQKENTKYTEYSDRRMELAKKYSYKDKDKKPQTVPGKAGFAIEDVATFNEKLVKLDKEYKKVLDAYTKFLEEEKLPVNIHKVAKDEFPDDFDVRGLSIFVKEK